MENQPLLSIIMPVYNAERYLERSISDVLGQTFQNLELLLVNDGSTDESQRICQTFANKDKRVIFIDFIKNRGVCSARNEAIKNARGKFLTFMDADDTLEQNAYQTIFNLIGDFDPQVVVFGAQEIYTDLDGTIRNTQSRVLPQQFFNNQESLRRYVITLEKSTLYGYLWNKFYNTEYIKNNDIYMKNYKIASDFFYNCDYFMDIATMAVLNYAPYHYYRRLEPSLTSGYFEDFFTTQEDRVSAVLAQYQYWNLYSDTVKNEMAKLYVRYVFAAVQRLFDPRAKLSKSKRKEWIENLYHSDLYSQLIPITRKEKKAYQIMSRLLEQQKTWKILYLGHLLFLLKRYTPFLFNRLKNR